MKRGGSLRYLPVSLVALASLLLPLLIAPTPAHALATLMDGLVPGSVTSCSAPIAQKFGNPVTAGSSITIGSITYVVNSSTGIANNSIQVKVSKDNLLSLGGTPITTFTQSSSTTSPSDGASYYRVTFTGSFNAVAGTTYFFETSYVNTAYTYSLCKSLASPTFSSNWKMYQVTNRTYLFGNGTVFEHTGYFYKFSLVEGVPLTTEISSISTTGNARSTNFRAPIQITANISQSSKVTFSANGKRISGCINVKTTGSAPNISAVCNWKPTNRGAALISVRAIPDNQSYPVATKSETQLLVGNRSGLR